MLSHSSNARIHRAGRKMWSLRSTASLHRGGSSWEVSLQVCLQKSPGGLGRSGVMLSPHGLYPRSPSSSFPEPSLTTRNFPVPETMIGLDGIWQVRCSEFSVWYSSASHGISHLFSAGARRESTYSSSSASFPSSPSSGSKRALSLPSSPSNSKPFAASSSSV